MDATECNSPMITQNNRIGSLQITSPSPQETFLFPKLSLISLRKVGSMAQVKFTITFKANKSDYTPVLNLLPAY